MGALRVVSQWAEDYQFAYLHTIPAILEFEDYSSGKFSVQLSFKDQLAWIDFRFDDSLWLIIYFSDPRLSLSKQLLCRQTAYRIDTDDSINSASVSKLKPAIKASGEGSCVSK